MWSRRLYLGGISLATLNGDCLIMSLLIENMRPRDLGFGMELSSLAGWNQVEADWEIFLKRDPNGNFIASWQGQQAGTTTTIRYGDTLAWIGMVLVHPEFRRKGIGKALMEHSLRYLKPAKIGLDATAAGRPLYEKLGFSAVSQWGRMVRMPGTVLKPNSKSSLRLADVTLITDLDAEIFGADRTFLLKSLYGQNHAVLYHRAGNQADGFLCWRKGRKAIQVGPMVAKSQGIAENLLADFLENHGDHLLFLDTFFHSDHWFGHLQTLGFELTREFSRMYLGNETLSGDVSRQFALAGPEFG